VDERRVSQIFRRRRRLDCTWQTEDDFKSFSEGKEKELKEGEGGENNEGDVKGGS
jgi:hypothetical protein